jgi:hypothetical protein
MLQFTRTQKKEATQEVVVAPEMKGKEQEEEEAATAVKMCV